MDQTAIMELAFKILPHIDKLKILFAGIQEAAKGNVAPLLKFLESIPPEKRDEIMKLVVSMASKLGSPEMLKLIT